MKTDVLASLLIPDWQVPLASNVRALHTTRAHGCSQAPYDDGNGGGGLNLASHVGDALDAVLRNRALLQNALPSAPVWLNQVHGTQVIDAAEFSHATQAPEADASFTSAAKVVCCVMTADCLPVLLCDAAGESVAAAHAGWRGLAAGVLQNSVQAMRGRGAQEIYAWLGPAIGPQAFEVGAEVKAAFLARLGDSASAAFRAVGDKYLADIYHLARLALAEVGVLQVAGGQECSLSQSDKYYSYRRQARTGRMAAMIWLED